LPAAAALIVAAWPIIFVLFDHGAFGAESTRLAAEALACYAVGLPAFVLVKVLAPGFFARGDTAMPVKIGLVAVALNLALNLAFMRPLQQMGPALATSIAAMFNTAGLAFVLIRRGQFRPDAQLLSRVPRTLAATIAMAVVLVAVQHALFRDASPAGGVKLLSLLALVLAGMLTYAAAGQAFGAFDLREARRMLRRRGLPAAGPSAITPPTTLR
jgi:putative peptidoglycan lipid II flippase